MPLIDFVDRFLLRKQAASNIKIKPITKKIGLKTEIYMRDSNFFKKNGVVNLRPLRGTQWIASTCVYYFDFYGFSHRNVY